MDFELDQDLDNELTVENEFEDNEGAEDIHFKEIEDDEDTLINIQEVRDFAKEEVVENKDILPLTEEETLLFKNMNLQIILADKNVENLQLKQSLFLKEKQEVMNEVNKLKIRVQENKKINIIDYVFDLQNKRIVHKKLLDKK
jgi:hypothetical protein